jgi:hypothetical protein
MIADASALPFGFMSLDEQIGWRGGPKAEGDLFQFAYGLKTGWRLVAEYDGEAGSAWVVVEDPISYRVHDERELIPYWVRRDEEGAPVSFAYEIAKSVYLDELSQGVTGLVNGPLRHFLLGGQNQCLEIIAREVPQILYVAPNLKVD